jgi:regulator of RNase E activity RraA
MIGFRILKRRRAVAPTLIEQFRKLPAANVSDNMSRIVSGGPTLRPMHAGGVMCGPALTVKSRPGDNLMLHKALDMAAPGDIIVCDAGGDLTNALFGELMLAHARKRGVAGLVLNGAIRDAGAIRAQSLPVFAAGVTHRGPYKDGPGEINVPIAIDGMVIEAGDLILGDDDGVVAVPFDAAETVLTATLGKQAAETKAMADIAAGTWERAWVDATLKKLGCVIES